MASLAPAQPAAQFALVPGEKERHPGNAGTLDEGHLGGIELGVGGAEFALDAIARSGGELDGLEGFGFGTLGTAS